MLTKFNPALVHRVVGRIGGLVFQPLRTANLVRAAWRIGVPPSAAQTAHYVAWSHAADLWRSVRLDVRAAWPAYGNLQGYGPYAAWQHLNTPALKAAVVTALTPPNPAYAPISAPDWQPGDPGAIDATWTYAGPPATAYCSAYYRLANAYAWTCASTVDANAEELTIAGLTPYATYEVALLPHDAAPALFAEAYHEYCDATPSPYEDFDTYTEEDPDSHVDPDGTEVYAHDITRDEKTWLYDDKGVDAFGTTWTHDLTWEWISADVEAVCVVWAVSNAVNHFKAWHDDDTQSLSLSLYRGPGYYRLNLKNTFDDTEHFFNDYAAPATYYITVERTDATHLEARVYNDAERTDLKHTHAIVIPAGHLHRYVFAVNSYRDYQAPACTYKVRDLDLHM